MNSGLPHEMHRDGIQQAVMTLYGCTCSHVSTAFVHETRDGHTVWRGDVLRFELEGHPDATEAFAWACDDGGEIRCIAILKVPPIQLPREAVQAALGTGKLRRSHSD